MNEVFCEELTFVAKRSLCVAKFSSLELVTQKAFDASADASHPLCMLINTIIASFDHRLLLQVWK